MRITYRNIVSTLLVAAIVVPYVGYLAWGQMPFIQDPRGMAATGLVLGLVAAGVAGRDVLAHEPMHRAAVVTGVAALGLGIEALWVATSELLLALFVVAVVVTWALGEIAATHGSVTTSRPMAHSA